MSTKELDLSCQAARAAKLDLAEIARAGMAENYHVMHDLEVVAHGTRKKYRDSIFSLLPRSLADQNSRVARGVFRGLSVHEILPLVFTPDAVDFFIEHAYNPFVFWNNILDTVDLFLREDKAALPLDIETVKQRIVGDNTPFGIVSSPYSDVHMGRLKATAQENGGKFDPNKLPAPYAFELIRVGFLLRKKLEDYRAPTVLVVNPMWEHLITGLVEAAPVAEGAKPTFTLSAHGAVTGLMEVEPVEGYTAETVAQLLTSRQAQIKDGEIVVNNISPKTGHVVIAKIAGDNKGVLIPATPVWTVIR